MAAGLPLSRTQLEILFLTSEVSGATTSEIAMKLHLTAGAVTQTIETLVRRELVERQHDTIDRRVIHHHLTKKGLQIIDEIKAAQHNRIKALVATMSAEEVDGTIRALQRVTAFINEGLQARYDRETENKKV